MQEKDIKNYKAFVSAFEAYDYASEFMLSAVVWWCLATACSLLFIGINVLSVAGVIIAGLLLIPSLWVYVKRKKRYLFLYTYLYTSSGFISFGALFVNALSHCANLYAAAIILTAVCYFVSLTVCCLLVRYRIKSNYYQTLPDSRRGRGNPPYVELSVGGGCAVLGMAIANCFSEALANIGDLLFFAIAVMCAIVIGYKGTEHLLRHIAVCKYDLEDAIRTRSDYVF